MSECTRCRVGQPCPHDLTIPHPNDVAYNGAFLDRRDAQTEGEYDRYRFRPPGRKERDIRGHQLGVPERVETSGRWNGLVTVMCACGFVLEGPMGCGVSPSMVDHAFDAHLRAVRDLERSAAICDVIGHLDTDRRRRCRACESYIGRSA